MDMRDPDRFEDLPILADLRDLLAAEMRAAAADGPLGATPRPPARRWALAGVRRAGLALAVGVALAVVAVGLVALHQRSAGPHSIGPATHSGPTPSIPAAPPPPMVPSAVNRAQRETIKQDPKCAETTNRGQTIDHGAPPQSMLSDLGVLRRPPLPADSTNKVLYSIGWDKGAGVYVNYIRRARTEYGRSYWIVPEARTTPFGPIPARCYREFRATLTRDLRHAAPAVRARTLHDQQEQLSAERAETEHREGLCFIEIGLHTRPHPGAVGFGCAAAPTDADPLSGGSGSGDSGGGTINSGILPDGFVSLTAHFPATAGAPEITLTSDVVNNVYVLKVPRRPGRAQMPDRWRLRRADGSVVTVGGVVPPPAATPVPPVNQGHGGGGRASGGGGSRASGGRGGGG